MSRSRVLGRTTSGLVLTTALLTAAGCSEAQDLLDEQTGGTLPDISIPDDIDLNSPDFTMPEIVAPGINIDIDLSEAPELPVIRFPDAVTIELPEITSDDVEVTETEDETIYTVEGQVLFEFDDAEIQPAAVPVLEEVLDAIANRGYGGTIQIAGHTDSKGTPEYNQDLSERRATGVALWFRERIPEDQQIEAVGYGESTPIARNTNDDGSDNPDGRAQNRRVEIIVEKS